MFDIKKMIVIGKTRELKEFTFEDLVKKLRDITDISPNMITRILGELLDQGKLIFDGVNFTSKQWGKSNENN